MGALHRGHLDLMLFARSRAAHVVASIFVNPTQFGPTEDFARYPRALEIDAAACEQAGVELLFAPTAEAMYSSKDPARVEAGSAATHLCGPFRPGHFAGVCTILAKFWNLTGPCVSIFGRKDYQQWKVLQQLARDLFFDVEVVGHPIVREADGLALSSRNRYLTASERDAALGIARGLRSAQHAFLAGERTSPALVAACATEVERSGLRIQYVELVDADALLPFDAQRSAERALLAVAAYAGNTRLIDNVVLGEDPSL